MTSFAHITMEKGAATIRSFEQVQREDAHNIQTHAVDIASLVSENLKDLYIMMALVHTCTTGLILSPLRVTSI